MEKNFEVKARRRAVRKAVMREKGVEIYVSG
jgi:hypothetical protein